MRATRAERTERRVHCYVKRGWCPVPWAHHPEPIKQVIRAMRWRPQLKSCFGNAHRAPGCICTAPEADDKLLDLNGNTVGSIEIVP